MSSIKYELIQCRYKNSPVRRVPMTLIASLATLMDFGRAYWVHKYESNWIAKICLDTYRTSDDNRTHRKMLCTVRKAWTPFCGKWEI